MNLISQVIVSVMTGERLKAFSFLVCCLSDAQRLKYVDWQCSFDSCLLNITLHFIKSVVLRG